MKNPTKYNKIESRNESFVQRAATRIWDETPTDENPYIAKFSRCFGYDILELAEKRSFSDVMFLLFKGELPNKEQSQLFNAILISMINPGHRHPATRAAMNAGVGKTDTAHILPIGLSILTGDYLGGGEVSNAMSFFREHHMTDVHELIEKFLIQEDPRPDGDWHIVPGFGSRFGDIDQMAQNIADALFQLPGCGKYIKWGRSLVSLINSHNMGWLNTGLSAAVFLDLGFHPRAGAGLFQLACGPGLLAHGLELANKPRSALPFPDDEHYFIDFKSE